MASLYCRRVSHERIKEALHELLKQAPVSQGRHGIDGRDVVQETHMPLVERTVVLRHGCFNCIHFNNTDVATKRWEERMFDTAKVLAERHLREGLSVQQATVIAAREVQRAYKLFQPPKTGICLIGKAVDLKTGQPGEFVSYKYKCPSWTGIAGTLHEKQAPLADELKDKIDGGEHVPDMLETFKD